VSVAEFSDAFRRGYEAAQADAPSHREATTGCVGAHDYDRSRSFPPFSGYSGPPQWEPWTCGPAGAWVDAVGCTADDAVRAGAYGHPADPYALLGAAVLVRLRDGTTVECTIAGIDQTIGAAQHTISLKAMEIVRARVAKKPAGE